MSVRYVRVKPVVDVFSPVIRPTGNMAIIGAAAAGDNNVARHVTSPADAAERFGPAFVPDPQDPTRRVLNSQLTASIALAFQQSPGPSQVWGIKAAGAGTGAVGDPEAALRAAESLNVQFVVLAATPVGDEPGGAVGKLVEHVVSVSNNAGDGMERMGVAMLARDVARADALRGALVDDRMVYIAHKSDQDAAAAVAGTIAGYDPHISMLLKPVAIDSEPFTTDQIDAINGNETFASGPAGNGVNWLVDPALIPGGGIHLGEGYTGNPGGKKYIDVVRTVDDVSFRLKARLIRSVGSLRISRSGLRALTAQMEAVLDQLQADEVIEGYRIVVPVLVLLDADPATLTPAQLQTINNAQTDRAVEIAVAVDYAGAMHRIAITLKFE